MQISSIIFLSIFLSLLFIILIILVILEILFEQGKLKNKPIKESTNVEDVFNMIEQSISLNKAKYVQKNNNGSNSDILENMEKDSNMIDKK